METIVPLPKNLNRLPPDTRQSYSSVRLRMIKGRSELVIPVEGEWLKDMGFPLYTPVKVIAFPYSICLLAIADGVPEHVGALLH